MVTTLVLAPASAADMTIGPAVTPNPPNQGTCAYNQPAHRPCVIMLTAGAAGETFTSSCDGTIARFRINGIPNANTYRLRVVHNNGNGTYKGTASSDAVSLAVDGVNTYTTSLPITTGDSIGLDFQQSTIDFSVRWRNPPGGQNVFYAFPADGTSTTNPPDFVETTNYMFNADVVCAGGGGARPSATQASCNRGADPGAAYQCFAGVRDVGTGPTSTPGGTVSFTSSQGGTFDSGPTCTLAPSTSFPNLASCSVTYTHGDGPTVLTANYGGDAQHGASSGTFDISPSCNPVLGTCSPSLLVCVGLWTSNCAGFPPPNPVRTCVSLWENCNGFGGSRGTPGRIDLSGFPSSLVTSAACKESRKNTLKRVAVTSAADGPPGDSTTVRVGDPCLIEIYMQSDDPKIKAQVKYELNVRKFQTSVDLRAAALTQGALIGCAAADCKETDILALVLVSKIKAVFDSAAKPGAPVNQNVRFDGTRFCTLFSSPATCTAFFNSLNEDLHKYLAELAQLKTELGVDKPLKVSGASLRSGGGGAIAAARRKHPLVLAWGSIRLAQGKSGRIWLKLSPRIRKVLRETLRSGRLRIRATGVITATIVPGVSSTRRIKLVILLSKRK
jgi:hypothetical protein